MAFRPHVGLPTLRRARTQRIALAAIPWTPTSSGSLPRSTRPCQADQAEARASASASSYSWDRRRRRKANRTASSTAERVAVNCSWAATSDIADMGDLLVKGTAPAPGTGRGWTVPEGTNEGAWRTVGSPESRKGRGRSARLRQAYSSTAKLDRE